MVGFEVKLLEYYNTTGNFHKIDYSLDYGKVRRTVKNDGRNRKGKVKMTSLVFDAYKPTHCPMQRVPDIVINFEKGVNKKCEN